MTLFLTTFIAFIAGVGISLAVSDQDLGHATIYGALFGAYLIQTTFYAH